MNQKQFLTLIVLGVLVGGLGLYLYNSKKQSFAPSSFKSGAKVISDFPLNDIAHLRIKETTNEVNLVRGETWTVRERNNYPANFSDISDFLRKIWELKPIQEVEAGKSQYGRLQLVSPAESQGTNSGTLVEFKDAKDATVKTIVLGKKHMKESQGGMFGGGGEFPVGRYVLVPGTSSKVWLVNETFANVEAKPEQWLSKDFFKIEKLKSLSVTYPDQPTNSWSVTRETEGGEWKLADLKEGEHFDSSKASGLNYVLSSPSFNDVVSPEGKPEEIGLDHPIVAKLETFDGFHYNLRLGGKTNEDNMYLAVNLEATLPKSRPAGNEEKPEDKEKLDKEFTEKNEKLQEKLKNEQRLEKWVYLVSKYTVDPLLKVRKDFLGEKKAEETGSGIPSLDGEQFNSLPFETVPPEFKDSLVPPLTKPVPPVVAPNSAAATEKSE